MLAAMEAVAGVEPELLGLLARCSQHDFADADTVGLRIGVVDGIGHILGRQHLAAHGDFPILVAGLDAVIGGVATTGGLGSPFGAVLGAVIIGIIEDIIVLFGISPYWQSVVSGGIVVLAISFDALGRRYFNREAA